MAGDQSPVSDKTWHIKKVGALNHTREAECFHPGVRVCSKGNLRTYSPLDVSSLRTSNALLHSFIKLISDLFSCFGYASLLPPNRPHKNPFPSPLLGEREVTVGIRTA